MAAKKYEELLENNRKWVEKKKSEDPAFFQNLAKIQTPKYLWIGCSDSRIPPNEVTGTQPGEIFVHRNIANLVVNTDLNLMSVLQYAVEALKVEEIIICGHYGCGGVIAALENRYHGLMDAWLLQIKDQYRLYQHELNMIATPEKRARRMVEINVIEQVYNLCKTPIIQRAWKFGHQPKIHGWVYDIADGIIHDLDISIMNDRDLLKIYKFDFRNDFNPYMMQKDNSGSAQKDTKDGVPAQDAPPILASPE